MGATIFDVAKRAGVSIGTVSRVINNRDRVHPETRERILQAMRDLNFHANASAQALASQQTDTVGLVIPQVNDSFFFGLVRGVEDTVTAAGYSLLIVSQPPQSANHHYMRLFQRGHVDAMIIAAIEVPRANVADMATRVPIIFIQQEGPKNVPAVLADNYGGACEMTQHLLEHGYRRIAYITGTDNTPDNRHRLRGVRDTLAAHGLSLPDHFVVRGDFLRGSGHAAMRALLDSVERPEAVFAANDQMAADAILAAQEAGLSVPGDIAITGFDDVPMASYMSPTLTTVHQPIYDQGAYAARLALDSLKADQERRTVMAPRITLPTRLVVRRSCGCEG
ncbi:MAG: LacI family DNA-binding transcriptional regulator [Anaerolineae bacterium]|nr:LacI family DNA-binding transcriptional regulator [Anaerolineae bacterium]